MKKYFTQAIFLTALLAFDLPYSYAQTEFFVRVNPTSGTITIVDDLPEINDITVFPNYTTFDQNNKRYIFKGKDISDNYFLYTVNAVTGQIISATPFPAFSGLDNLIEFQYDNSTDILYGLRYDSDTDSEFFCSIDLSTGLWEIINPIPIQDPAITSPNGMEVHFTTYDTNQHLYIIRALDNSGNSRLYRILASTGGVISSPLFPILSDIQDQIHELQFDNATGTLYGIFNDASEATFSLVSIDPITGVHTIISSIPGMQALDTTDGYTYFDEPNHRYFFRGMIAGGWKLLGIDATTGAIVSSPPFPQLADTNDDVIELQFDNLTGILYALHWDNEVLGIQNQTMLSSNINLYPNPFSSTATLTLNKTYNEMNIEISTITGRNCKKDTHYNTDAIEIKRDNLPAGIYFLKITGDQQYIGTKKLIIE